MQFTKGTLTHLYETKQEDLWVTQQKCNAWTFIQGTQNSEYSGDTYSIWQYCNVDAHNGAALSLREVDPGRLGFCCLLYSHF